MYLISAMIEEDAVVVERELVLNVFWSVLRTCLGVDRSIGVKT
jgi:hypothetical protein